MSVDVAARLRLLAQDHHDGRIDLAAYRALRAPLLDSLALNVSAIASAMEITQPRGAARTAGDEATTWPGKPGAPSVLNEGAAQSSSSNGSAEPSSVASPRRLPVGVMGVGVAIVVAAVIALWMWRAPLSGDGTSQAVPTGAEGRVHDLVNPFIERGDWSDGQLASLNASLLELGGAQLATVASETWFQRFVDELRRRLKEQQALATSPLTIDNSPLAALAVTVGLDLDSPDAAIHIAALPAPPPAPVAEAAPPSVKPGIVHHSAAQHDVDNAASHPAQQAAPPSSEEVGVVSNPLRPDTDAGAAMMRSVPSASENACRVELIGSRRPLCHDMLPAGDAPVMALVPAGTFEMGSTVTSEEQPVHRVTIREPFAISVYEVSQGDFRQFCERTNRTCGSQPWSGDDYPVVNVSWDDARAYTEWLTSVTHHRYSLPTEAQWEYAARAGQTGLFPSGDTLSPTDAHYSMLAKQTTAARRAEKFKANAFRLVHVIGNVREWVEDGWSPNFAGAPSDGSAAKATQAATHVARGGSYTDSASRLRLSMREGLAAGTRDTTTGFRIVRELP